MDSPIWTHFMIKKSNCMVSVDLIEQAAFSRNQAGLSVSEPCKNCIM